MCVHFRVFLCCWMYLLLLTCRAVSATSCSLRLKIPSLTQCPSTAGKSVVRPPGASLGCLITQGLVWTFHCRTSVSFLPLVSQPAWAPSVLHMHLDPTKTALAPQAKPQGRRHREGLMDAGSTKLAPRLTLQVLTALAARYLVTLQTLYLLLAPHALRVPGKAKNITEESSL